MHVTKEIKRFLLGRVYVQDGILAVEQDSKLATLTWQGVLNGSMSALLYGVAKKERTYNVEDSEKSFLDFGTCFTRIGRLSYIAEDENAVGCFKKNGMGNIVFYTLERDLYLQGTLTVTAFTARGIFARLRLRKAFSLLDRQLSVDLGITEQSKAEVKALKSQEKEAKKDAKEQAKLEKKVAKEIDPSMSQNRRINR